MFRSWIRVLAPLAVAILLSACGGGGGHGADTPGNPSQPTAGDFSLSADTAAFIADQNAAPPATTTLTMNITGGGVAQVGAAYTGGQTQPAWLGISMSGAGNTYSITLTIRSTAMAPGQYSTSFAVGTADANNTVLRSKNISVTYMVSPVAVVGGPGGGTLPTGDFTLSSNSIEFTALPNSAAPLVKSLSVTLTGQAASVGAAYLPGEVQPSWLGIVLSGSGSVYSMQLSILSTSLPVGQHSTTFAVSTAAANGTILRSQNVTVTFAVLGPLQMSSATLAHSLIYGDVSTTRSHVVTVVAPNREWRATSNAPWLQVSAAAQEGSAALNATIDVSTLAPGTYQGVITLTNTQIAQDSVSQNVQVTVVAPQLTVTQGPMLLGGSDGLSNAPRALVFSLTTGQATHPFAVQLMTDGGGSWLNASAMSGVVGAQGAALQLSADASNLNGGTYTGQVRVTATVRSLTLTALLPVTFNLEASRIVVAAAGVALSSSPMPARSVLTRDVTVFSSIPRTDVPWAASSDRPWLTVTPSGLAGQAVTLTANPAGLQTDTTHFATVTVTSSDPRVENDETIRVGFHINDTAPADLSNAVTGVFVAASPVEPVVFVNNVGTGVQGYDVYTGALVRNFPAIVDTAGTMVVSGDGSRLFIYDYANLRVTEVDASSGALVRHYDSGIRNGTEPVGGGLAYLRPSGHALLITPSSKVYDLDAGTSYVLPNFTSPVEAYSLHASMDGRYVTTHTGRVQPIDRTALNGGQVTVGHGFGSNYAGGRPGQACINADSSLIYMAAGAPYFFPSIRFDTQTPGPILPGTHYPSSLLCLWNGVIVGGGDSYYDVADIWIYDDATSQELARRSSSSSVTAYRSLRDRGMAASGDATRLITLSHSMNGNQVRFQSIPGPL